MLFADMTTSRRVSDQAAGRGHSHSRGRGRVSSSILGTSGSSLSTPTTPVTSHVAGLVDQPFIIVPSPNYVPPSTVRMPPPTAQQPTAIVTPPPTTEAAALESSYGSEAANATLSLPIVWLTIWPDSGTGFVPNNNLHFIWDAEHNLTIKKIFGHGMGRRLQHMLDNIRQRRDHLTSGLRPKINKALLVHWETDEGFRHRRLTNRANRTLARSSKYTGGPSTFMKTKTT
ncbi:hypothetical protein Ahy_A07g036968 [Arachis hypogaea]|uniref:Uncharacterized protein n=1 Tax=Arachis hypogaea TaxID=3818 RepID=A0A445CHH8_ARAHY|nr:hypothetical protein Ahy_A07g036968 [Arachis hypogaea]